MDRYRHRCVYDYMAGFSLDPVCQNICTLHTIMNVIFRITVVVILLYLHDFDMTFDRHNNIYNNI